MALRASYLGCTAALALPVLAQFIARAVHAAAAAAKLVLGTPDAKSLVCPAGGPCPTMDYWPWALRSLLQKQIRPPEGLVQRALAQRFRAREAAGARPLLVYVGPADSAEELAELAELWRRHRPRVVVVEPNAQVLPRLAQTLSGAGFEVADVHTVNAALCEHDADSAPLYTLSQQLLHDFPQLDSAFHESWSLSREVLVTSHLRDFATKNRAGYSWEEWASMLRYVEALPVRCLSAAGLLRELKIAPGELDAVFVDAEGYDVELVRQLLALEGFAPAVLLWEWWVWSTSFDAAGNDIFETSIAPLAGPMAALAARGYAIHQSQNNLIALDVQ